jgi:hypothetical protein
MKKKAAAAISRRGRMMQGTAMAATFFFFVATAAGGGVRVEVAVEEGVEGARVMVTVVICAGVRAERRRLVCLTNEEEEVMEKPDVQEDGVGKT